MPRSLPGQIGRYRLIERTLHLGDEKDQTWTGTQQTQVTALLDKPLEWDLAGATQLGQELH
jgi:hypothetical protein